MKNLHQINHCAQSATNNNGMPFENVHKLPLVVRDNDDKEFEVSDTSVLIDENDKPIAVIITLGKQVNL